MGAPSEPDPFGDLASWLWGLLWRLIFGPLKGD